VSDAAGIEGSTGIATANTARGTRLEALPSSSTKPELLRSRYSMLLRGTGTALCRQERRSSQTRGTSRGVRRRASTLKLEGIRTSGSCTRSSVQNRSRPAGTQDRAYYSHMRIVPVHTFGKRDTPRQAQNGCSPGPHLTGHTGAFYLRSVHVWCRGTTSDPSQEVISCVRSSPSLCCSSAPA